MPAVSQGYVYVAAGQPGEWAAAVPGGRIQLPSADPPWIVVDHQIESVVVARWPGKLWRVLIVDTQGIEQPRSTANYTRARAVDVLEEVPAGRLFGDHGAAICEVLEKARSLNVEEVQALGLARHPDAGQAYSRAWATWLGITGGATHYQHQDLSQTLAIPSGERRSPVNYGFTILHRLVWDRAVELVGPTVLLTDEDDELSLDPTWAAAGTALLEAAMARGAPHLSSEQDQTSLLSAWRTVFGDRD